jgi:hypothetical protein
MTNAELELAILRRYTEHHHIIGTVAGFHQDEVDHWVAELACGHFQHVRHDPPWVERPWVITKAGRTNMLGQLGQRLNCKKCDAGVPPDHL